MSDSRARDVAPEHRWFAIGATFVALGSYALLPSAIPIVERYVVVGVCLLMLVPLVILNPHHLTRETRWSRRVEIALSLLILIANLVAFV